MISTKAGCVGLNLTVASVCILYDLDWNPYNDLQAIRRIYRYWIFYKFEMNRQGQKEHVFIYKLICKDTIDEYMYVKGKDKQKLGQDILKDTVLLRIVFCYFIEY